MALSAYVWSNKDSPPVEKYHVGKHKLLGIQKFREPNCMLPSVQREMADITVRPVLIFFERLWRLENIAKEWENGNVIPVFKKDKKEDLGKYGLVSLNSVQRVMLEQITLEIISKHLKGRKVRNPSQRGFKKGKSCLTNMTVNYNITDSVDEGNFNKASASNFAFHTASCNETINRKLHLNKRKNLLGG